MKVAFRPFRNKIRSISSFASSNESAANVSHTLICVVETQIEEHSYQSFSNIPPSFP